MYTPDAFRMASVADCHAWMRQHSFATLVTPVSGHPPAITHLPLMVDAEQGEFGVLRGHVARANPHWREFAASASSVAIFQGPHAYISPRWYAATVAVPTWNYVAVHAHGRPEIVDDPGEVRAFLEQLAERYESGSEPWRVAELPREVYRELSAGIVCFSMVIDRLEGKAKLGQNRSAADQAGLQAGLEGTGDPFAARLAHLSRDWPAV